MDQQRPQSDREAAVAALNQLLASLGAAATVTVQTTAGHLASFHLPPPSPPRDDPERDCRADVLAVLRDVGRRMTTTQILAELERRGWLWGERTVKGYLADMVVDGELERRGWLWGERTGEGYLADMVVDGDLTKDARAHPPGYGVQESSAGT